MRRALIHMDLKQIKDGLALLHAARQLLCDDACILHLLMLNGDAEPWMGKVDLVFHLKSLGDQNKVPKMMAPNLAATLADLYQRHAYDCILLSDNRENSTVATRLAVKIGSGLVTGVRAIREDENGPCCLRLTEGGQTIDHFASQSGQPIVATVKPRFFQSDQPAHTTVRMTECVVLGDLEAKSQSLKLVGARELEQTDICDSDILISGGRGVARNFEALKPLACALGGQVSASRAIVDSGLANRSVQVGQTGKKVNPRLYMALGINGAIQHVLGLQGAEHILSVNTNVNAPICSLSDMVVEGDALTFIEQLLKKIKEEQNHGTF